MIPCRHTTGRARARLLAIFFSLSLSSAAAGAEIPIPAPPSIGATSFILMDHHSGRVLAEKDADETAGPASITKVMTSYVAFKELRSGEIALDDRVSVSEKAWRMQGSRMFIEVDKEVRVEDLLKGIIVQSGNDASVALAEYIAGSEDTFAALMNEYAQRLGMTATHFENSTGLPGETHYSSARDIAILSRALISEFPDYYEWYAQRNFTFNEIEQHNRNTLLWRDDSVDGVKTGHTEAAGYCLAASAVRDGMRLTAVVLGAASEENRAQASQALLNYGFRFFETHRLYGPGEPITTARVWKGASDEATLGVKDELYVTIPRGRYADLLPTMDRRARLLAPLTTEESLGAVRVALGDEVLVEAPLFALEPVEPGSLWQRTVDSVLLWFE